MNREIKFRVWSAKQKTFIDDIWIAFAHTYSRKNNCIQNSETDVIQQFTGLKDRNSRDIYEGDILECTFRSESRFVKVQFHNGCFLFETRAPMEFLQYNEVRVAGNIFENPELVKLLRDIYE